MNKNDKIIYILVGIIIVSSILLFIVDNSTPYDEDMYDKAYSEYDKISQIVSNNTNQTVSNNKDNINNTSNNNIIEQNYFSNQDIITYEPIKKPTPTYSTIGIIDIPKINISYPVLKDYKEEYLNIAPLKLVGPEPNTAGNLVIVAHNNIISICCINFTIFF